ncbi:unknown [Phocaeicola coprophilus CAG:333]|jgi:hypothetical protein|uniref:hypothetical protein n=1 Tax=Phocaeicola coprophilus TaxID=387090 RepID=UPI0003412CC6|nr:hypothetical protein [Phocaeicola coprophilus]CDC54081.1 unknown [Phocaeicola coprophilus CAG:333]
MKKRRILLTCVTIVAIAAYIQVSSDNHILTISDLESTEAIAGCEVSSDPSKNTGYCSKLKDGSDDACVSSGNGSEVRCSGNTK